MRRKREHSLQENTEEQPVAGKRKLKFNSSKEAKITDAKTVNENTIGKSKSSRRKAKDVKVVSEYFKSPKEKKQEESSLALKNKKRSKANASGDKNGFGRKESDEENEFEESSISYRSPSVAKASKRNAKKKDPAPISCEKKCAKKRKSEESEKVKPAKKTKKGQKDEVNDTGSKYEKSIEKEDNSTKETILEEALELKEGEKKTGIRSQTIAGSKRRSKKKSSADINDSVSDVKRKKPDSKRKKAKSEKETNGKSHSSTSKAVTGKMAEPLPVKEFSLPKTLDHLNVTAVLLHMEGAAKVTQALVVQPSTSGDAAGADDDGVMSDIDDSDADSVDGDIEAESEESEEDDWEEVEDHHGHSPRKSQIPDKPVEFTLEAPLLHKKKKRGEFDWKAYLRRKMNRFKKEVAMEIHKVHLLCLTARCLYLNNVYQDDLLKAQAMSVVVVTRELNLTSVKKCTTDQLGKLFTWIQQTFTTAKFDDNSEEDAKQTLRFKVRSCLQTRCASSHLEFVSVCVLLLRQIGFNTRLTMSLQPLPFKETGTKASGKGKAPARKSNNKSHNKTKSDKGSSKSGNVKTKPTENSPTSSSGKNEKSTKAKNSTSKKGNSAKTDSKSENNKSSASKKRSRRRCSKELPEDVYKDDEDAGADSEEEYDPREDDDSGEDRGKRGKGKAKHKTEIDDTSTDKSVEESDSDFEEDSILIRTQALKRKSPGSKNKKVLSSDSDSSVDSVRGADEWLEVYLEKEQRWICIDCVTGRLGKPYDIEHKATQPVTYVVGVDNDGNIKDVTQRYASQWLTSTRKLRVDTEWWTDTLKPYRCTDVRLDKLEDQDIQSALEKRPLPTSIGDFKSHPLYALERHLLKFEAIYPPSAVPLGYIRGEPVYARECVYTLHSRENWLKEGRAVRLGEEAYKYVKSRPKWNKPKDNPEAKDLEIFGIWQTELYIPPPAVDGKVPRNAHGNVEMFLPSMLPAGTVHLQLAGLNKVAKKLDIDCAPAMVGWDHHCGYSHPLMDGWIVCEEFKDILLAAWDEEQEIIQEREAAKREKRVYDNWRKLIRGLLIRERLKKTFDLESDKKVAEAGTSKEKKRDGPENGKVKPEAVQEKATDVQYAWPQNRMKSEATTYKVEEL